MSRPTTGSEVIGFGPFVVDLRTGELTRNGGNRILLPDQPLRLLALLVRQPGVMVSRDDLRRELWADDTFVDFERSLNTAIKRLREVLGDSASAPRFIETLPRHGYRFIAPVEARGASATLDNVAATAASTVPAAEPDAAETSAAAPVRKRWLGTSTLVYGLAAAGVVILAVVGARSAAIRNGEPPPMIAVLPLKNLSVESDSEYFVDGLTDELIQNLSMIEGLGVRSRTSSFAFKTRQAASIREVGELLEANLVLEGSVLREGQRLRVNAQLVRVSDDVSLWSGRFDREMKDIFAIQEEISRSIVNALRLKLGRGQRRHNTNVEAYDLFLKARVLQTRRAADARRAADLFEQVVQKDPAFAPGYAGLASAYAGVSFYFPMPGGFAVSQDHAAAIMRPAALKAIELDPLLADAHAAMGHLHSLDRDWAKAETSFRHALELNPKLTTTYTDFVLSALFPQGKLDEAMRLLEAALRLDPLSLDVRRLLANVQISAGLHDRALDNCQRVLDIDPDFAFVAAWRARALLHKGRVAEAIAWFETQGEGRDGFLGYAYAISGRRAEAEALAASSAQYPQQQVLIYSGLGDKDRAFEALERLAAVNARRAGAYLTRPELASLRGDPRLTALRKTLGLPPA